MNPRRPMVDAIIWAFAAGLVTGTVSTFAFVVVTIQRVQRLHERNKGRDK